jgi:hypothetical protein
MKTTVFIERTESGRYSAYMDYSENIDFGLHGEGDTVEAAIEDFYLSRNEMMQYYKEENKSFPKDLIFEFKYDVASFLEYYSKKLSLAGLQRITGINQGQLSHYITGHSKPSRKTAERIEKSLHEFADEIRRLHFV